jgi:CRP-like cAMP-binding protein
MNPLFGKLEQFGPLSEEHRTALRDAALEVRSFRPREDIIREGERPDVVHLLLKGWAARYKDLPGGERQIMAFLIPGDLCDIHTTLLDQMDHSIGTLSPAKVAFIARERMEAMLEKGDALSRALWWATLVDEAVLREWLVNLGQRPAEKRLAHMVCEMLLRARAVGLTNDDSFEMPVTQEQLGDALGMSTVHMNRTLQALRAQGLINYHGKRMTIDDLPRLMAFSDFNPNYLHQNGNRPSQPGRSAPSLALTASENSSRPV